jgi:hypothetical protein
MAIEVKAEGSGRAKDFCFKGRSYERRESRDA